jgi:pimeloyl-ACP methyl ester carboxylesterase
LRRRHFTPALLTLVVAACAVDASESFPLPVGTVSSSPSVTNNISGWFDLGYRTMHLECVGPVDRHQPSILLEAGAGSDSSTWSQVVPVMSQAHRVCAYDRAGLGLSQAPREPSRTAADQAADLEALLRVAGVDGPFVIGAQGYGAVQAILFTQAHPDEVAGLVLIDPEGPTVTTQFLDALPPKYDGEPMAIAAVRSTWQDSLTGAWRNREHLDVEASDSEAAAALQAPGPLFGDRPVAVLSAHRSPGTEFRLPVELASTIDQIWFGAQHELADESTAGWLEDVPDTGPEIQTDEPQVVIDAVQRILQELVSS